jgi:hypothetical protein
MAYIADSFYDLMLVNVANPATPYLQGFTETPSPARKVKVQGDIAYVQESGAIDIYDISSPAAIQSLCSYNNPYTVNDFALEDDYLYVAASYTGMLILDVSNPAAPDSISVYDTADAANLVIVKDEIAYLAEYNILRIIDVSHPTAPVQMGYYFGNMYISDVAVAGNVIYLSQAEYGLQIIDASNPAAPALVSTLLPHPTSRINQFMVEGNRLYVADWVWNEISIYNIDNPLQPVLSYRYAWNMIADSFFARGDMLYTLCGSYDLQIHHLSELVGNDEEVITATDNPLRCYPNPFLRATTIDFTEPGKSTAADELTLSIYNLKGQRIISTVFAANQQRENLSWQWDGQDENGSVCSHGTYLIKLEAGGRRIATGKVTILK